MDDLMSTQSSTLRLTHGKPFRSHLQLYLTYRAVGLLRMASQVQSGIHGVAHDDEKLVG